MLWKKTTCLIRCWDTDNDRIMDIIRELGELALSNRLKRLSDRLMQDGIRVYKDAGVEFEPRWFPLYYYLIVQGPSAVMDIAKGLGISHPAVSQVAKEMIAAGLLASYKDANDKRKRLLAMTKKGREMFPEMQTIWNDVRGALEEIVQERQTHFLEILTTVEREMEKKNFHERFLERFTSRQQGEIEIIDYDRRYQQDFFDLNRDWIDEYFEMEEADHKVLQQPYEAVVEPGGAVIFARNRKNGQIIGTCALINHQDGTGELTKMAVAKFARGRQTGRQLGEGIVERARNLGMKTLYLETNSRLLPALSLYRSMGFVQVDVDVNSKYVRADVRMALELRY